MLHLSIKAKVIRKEHPLTAPSLYRAPVGGSIAPRVFHKRQTKARRRPFVTSSGAQDIGYDAPKSGGRSARWFCWTVSRSPHFLIP